MAGLTDQQRKGIRDAITVNSCSCGGIDVPWKGMSAAQIESLTDNELRVYDKWITSLTQAVEKAVGRQQVSGSVVGNASGGTLPPPPPPPAPAKRPGSLAEAVDQFGTPEEKAVWNSMVQFHQQQKGQLIERLMSHITDQQQREAVYNYLKDKSVDDLQYELILHPPPAQVGNQQQGAPRPSFFGAAGAPPLSVPTDEEPLMSPVYNWDRGKNGAVLVPSK